MHASIHKCWRYTCTNQCHGGGGKRRRRRRGEEEEGLVGRGSELRHT